MKLNPLSSTPAFRRLVCVAWALVLMGSAAQALPIEPAFNRVVMPTPIPLTFEKTDLMSWKTEYVGRVQMSFPVQGPRSWSNEFDMADVKLLHEMTPEQFWNGVEIVRQRYKKQTHRKFSSRLALYEKVGGNAAFVFHYESPNSFWAPVLERFVHLDDQHVYEMRTGSLDTPNVPPTSDIFSSNVKEYTPVLSRIHPLKEGQAPNRDGLSIEGAVVSGDTGRNAVAGLNVEIASGSDLGVGYRENLYQVAIRSVFEELALNEARAEHLSKYDDPLAVREFKVLRRQERTLSGMAGQEFITRTTLKNGHVYYRCRWGIKGSNDGGLLEPAIAVWLQTPNDPEVSEGHSPYAKLPPEAELIKLWDFAVASFKWRAGALPVGQQIRAVN